MDAKAIDLLVLENVFDVDQGFQTKKIYVYFVFDFENGLMLIKYFYRRKMVDFSCHIIRLFKLN